MHLHPSHLLYTVDHDRMLRLDMRCYRSVQSVNVWSLADGAISGSIQLAKVRLVFCLILFGNSKMVFSIFRSNVRAISFMITQWKQLTYLESNNHGTQQQDNQTNNFLWICEWAPQKYVELFSSCDRLHDAYSVMASILYDIYKKVQFQSVYRYWMICELSRQR